VCRALNVLVGIFKYIGTYTKLLSVIRSEVTEIGDDNGFIILITSYAVLVYFHCVGSMYTVQVYNNNIQVCRPSSSSLVCTGWFLYCLELRNNYTMSELKQCLVRIIQIHPVYITYIP